MPSTFNRREFVKSSTAAATAICAGPLASSRLLAAENQEKPLYRISLAEWSLHRTINAGKLKNLDFPATAKNEFGIDAVEYVNQLFKDRTTEAGYLKELKQRCSDLGVSSQLIMVDGEGALGDPDDAKRKKAVENHHRWVEAAKYLGCHSIRVNAQSKGERDEQMKLAADGLRQLCEFTSSYDLNVIVENHGGLSSDGQWLAGVMKQVNLANCGTLPDFGNFYDYDRYQGVTDLMPWAKAVSAKSHSFDEDGNEEKTDYFRMMKIVVDAGFRGYVGIEWEGSQPDEFKGIRLTKELLERVRDRLAAG